MANGLARAPGGLEFGHDIQHTFPPCYASNAQGQSNVKSADSDRSRLARALENQLRVRLGSDSHYVDLHDFLGSLSAQQHQLVWGRRGTGKTALLLHYHTVRAPKESILSVYVDAAWSRGLNNSFEESMAQTLLNVFDGIPGPGAFALVLRRDPRGAARRSLEGLLDSAAVARVRRSRFQTKGTARSLGASLTSKIPGVSAAMSMVAASGREETEERTEAFVATREEALNRLLGNLARQLQACLAASKKQRGVIIVDNFHEFRRSDQGRIARELMTIGDRTGFSLKLAAVRSATSIAEAVTSGHDIHDLDLDSKFSLEQIDVVEEMLCAMLTQVGATAGITNATTRFFDSAAIRLLVIASGGVPRDFLALVAATVENRSSTAVDIWRAAQQRTENAGVSQLRVEAGIDATELGWLYEDIRRFCTDESKSPVFRLPQKEALRPFHVESLLLELVDFGLIHVVQNASSGAAGSKVFLLGLGSTNSRAVLELAQQWSASDVQGFAPSILTNPQTYPLDHAARVIEERRASQT